MGDDLDYTADDLVRILEEILRENGPLTTQLLGQYLRVSYLLYYTAGAYLSNSFC